MEVAFDVIIAASPGIWFCLNLVHEYSRISCLRKRIGKKGLDRSSLGSLALLQRIAAPSVRTRISQGQ